MFHSTFRYLFFVEDLYFIYVYCIYFQQHSHIRWCSCRWTVRRRMQERIQDFKLRGANLKKITPSGRNCEHLLGISCEKSRFYAQKILFFPTLGGRTGCVPPGSAPGMSLVVQELLTFTSGFIKVSASSLAKGYDSGPPSLHPWQI